MLFIKDNIVKDSSLITLEINDKIVYNPSQELLEEHGWSLFSNNNITQFLNRRFIETTSDVFGSVDKSEYVDTIVFLKDLKKIYLNEEYFGGEDLSVDYEYIENVTLGELISLKTIKKLIPGQKYNITNYHTEIDDAVGVVSYNENEKHHIVVQALTNSTLDQNAKSISFVDVNNTQILEPTGNFELVAKKCSWYPDEERYTEDNEYYKYLGETLEIDGITYYVWNKYENGARVDKSCGKARVLTETLDFECSLENPYHPEFAIYEDDTINDNYVFTDDIRDLTFDNYITDSFCEVERIDKQVYNYNVVMNACDWIKEDDAYGRDYGSWYEFNGDTIEIDGVTYFKWNKYGDSVTGEISNACLPLTTSLYIDCSIEQPYAPDLWISIDGELNGDYFDATKTDIFCGIRESNLPDIENIIVSNFKPYVCDVNFDIDNNIITWMKDEFGNEAPYDFKHIKFEGLYTFGTEVEDYSLNGFENSVYNNKILKPIDSQYNRINFSEKNVYGNTIYPSVVNCAIDFPIKESLITKSGLGLHVFDPTSFITPISVNGI